MVNLELEAIYFLLMFKNQDINIVLDHTFWSSIMSKWGSYFPIVMCSIEPSCTMTMIVIFKLFQEEPGGQRALIFDQGNRISQVKTSWTISCLCDAKFCRLYAIQNTIYNFPM